MIQVEGLTKYYDDFCAVDRIDFAIQKGEIIGLLGPNGAGKTTTLRMLTGYFKPTAGQVKIKDFDIQEDIVAIKQLIGYLPESAPLYPGMLVYDYLDYVASIRKLTGDAKAKRLRRLVGLCGLQGIMHKTIGELSKGLKQRVGLAHAMMSDPEILILDEPTSGLDPNQIVEIRDIIREIGREKTVILSTHILSEAEATCDRIVIIHQGRIVADDRTENLKQSGSHTRRIHLALQNADPADAIATLNTIDGITATASPGPDGILGLTLTCRGTDDPRPAVYAAIKATDWVLVEFVQQTKNLETIFRELTKEN
ncbi:MAG: ATP-binding cassette domain-containing protein [Desulfobacteraceae bacterium]|nr:ATP-binding cassette domain-containing protein [Desulfobacteraceae bacterium]MBC2749288.1 ATP-binding cassette domain-containing protein [Desulfobacteraceae bacterium]